jgi:hypothetical protein
MRTTTLRKTAVTATPMTTAVRQKFCRTGSAALPCTRSWTVLPGGGLSSTGAVEPARYASEIMNR